MRHQPNIDRGLWRPSFILHKHESCLQRSKVGDFDLSDKSRSLMPKIFEAEDLHTLLSSGQAFKDLSNNGITTNYCIREEFDARTPWQRLIYILSTQCIRRCTLQLTMNLKNWLLSSCLQKQQILTTQNPIYAGKCII